MMVTSPYNFVSAPTEQEVLKPWWAKHVSHDIPFLDAVSGKITFTLAAETDIFVRNGSGNVRDGEGQQATELPARFSHVQLPNGSRRYFIPASSIKGMVRNVLEIMSRSRLRIFNDHQHAVRQIMKTKEDNYSEEYSLLKDEEKKKIWAGYLVRRGDKYYIYSCGRPMKIRHTHLSELFELKGDQSFDKQFGGKEIDPSRKTARYKYEELIKGRSLESEFVTFPEAEQKGWVNTFQHLQYVVPANGDGEAFWGRVVCTGQATPYSVSTARKGEYVFRGRRADVIEDESKRYEVPHEVWQTFLHVHRDGAHDESEDWKYWKKQKKEGIPVFFRKEKGRKVVRDFGLTFMYKEPVKYSVGDLLGYEDPNAKKYQPDFVETLFGYVRKDGASLKGRVFFAHAFAKNSVREAAEPCRAVLASPKSSFYPYYLRPDKHGGILYNPYNTGGSVNGFKRYPVHREAKCPTMESEVNEKIVSTFIPLLRGATFRAQVYFHNLKPAELGGLLSALTFHGSEGEYFHSLGGGKPFGFGRVALKIEQVTLFDYDNGGRARVLKQADQNRYLDAFACLMRSHLGENGKNWPDCHYMKELFAMARVQSSDVESRLVYLQSDEGAASDPQKYQEVKRKALYLERYTKWPGVDRDSLACRVQEPDERECTQNEQNIQRLRDDIIKKMLRNKVRITDFLQEIEKGRVEEAEKQLDEIKRAVKEYLPGEAEEMKSAFFVDLWVALERLKMRKKIDEKSLIDSLDHYASDKKHTLNNMTYLDSRIREELITYLEEQVEARKKRLRSRREQTKQQPFQFSEETTFDGIKKMIRSCNLKKGEMFKEERLREIEDALSRCFERERGGSIPRRLCRFFKKGKVVPFNNYPWTDTCKWLGEDRAKALYEKLTRGKGL